MTEYIAPYILASEYKCSHCQKIPPGLVKDENDEWPLVFQALFDRFKDLREEHGPITITSAYRCPAHPLSKKDGAAGKLSVHVFGLALDVDDPAGEIVRLVEQLCPELRMGTYADGHVHLDVGYFIRPKYSENLIEGARWTG